MDEPTTSDEISLGGNLSGATRLANSVHRASGRWTPTVHALLKFLGDVGFGGAPLPMGFDAAGREVLEFIEGDSWPSPPYPAVVTSDQALVDAALLLRSYHDLSLGFPVDDRAIWQDSAAEDGPIEVIAHRDWTPYNAVFRDGRLVAMLDWDLARPGSRIADLAWSALMWVPLVADKAAVESGWALPLDRIGRLALFCDAYGLDNPSRIIAAVQDRIISHLRWVNSQADAGHSAYLAMVGDGAIDFYSESLSYLTAHAATWRHVLADGGGTPNG